jgi:putative ABC transport system substrate-binding protein
MNRRELIALLCCTVAIPGHSQAQPRKARIGVLWHAANEQEEAAFIAPLRQGFAQLGYVEGKDFVLENRYPAEKPELFERFARELAALEVDVLVAISRPAAIAAKRATSTIPVVFCPVPDPVALGLVSSLARPGGNVTGISTIGPEILAKRVEILKEALPAISHVALLLDSTNRLDPVEFALTKSHAAAEQLGLKFSAIEARSANDFELAFDNVRKGAIGAVLVAPNTLYFNERKALADAALKYKVPIMAPAELFTKAGGLMSYSPDWPTLFRRIAHYVDKILKGANPSDLPVEQATHFHLVINLKTATALGLTIAPALLARADEVVE